MPVDDDLEVGRATDADDAASPRSNRGFWLVAGALGFACVFVLIEIFANFGTKDTIAHAEATLRAAQAAVGSAASTEGSVARLDATRLATIEPALAWVPGTEASDDLDEVSFQTRGAAWAAAVQARPGACFYLHETGSGEVFYGVGTVCTGEEALRATDPRW